MDCSPSASSVHRILQGRILEWVALPSSRGFSQPGIQPRSPACRQILYQLSLQGSPRALSVQFSSVAQSCLGEIVLTNFFKPRPLHWWSQKCRLGPPWHQTESRTPLQRPPWMKSYDQPRQHIKKQRHYFANKGPSSQSYGFSSSHVWM